MGVSPLRSVAASVKSTRGRAAAAASTVCRKARVSSGVFGPHDWKRQTSGVDRDSGKSIAISTFDTREQAMFSREILGDAIAPLLALGWQGDDPEIYVKAP